MDDQSTRDDDHTYGEGANSPSEEARKISSWPALLGHKVTSEDDSRALWYLRAMDPTAGSTIGIAQFLDREDQGFIESGVGLTAELQNRFKVLDLMPASRILLFL